MVRKRPGGCGIVPTFDDSAELNLVTREAFWRIENDPRGLRFLEVPAGFHGNFGESDLALHIVEEVSTGTHPPTI